MLPVRGPPGPWCRFVAFEGGVDGEEDVVEPGLEVALSCAREGLVGDEGAFEVEESAKVLKGMYEGLSGGRIGGIFERCLEAGLGGFVRALAGHSEKMTTLKDACDLNSCALRPTQRS